MNLLLTYEFSSFSFENLDFVVDFVGLLVSGRKRGARLSAELPLPEVAATGLPELDTGLISFPGGGAGAMKIAPGKLEASSSGKLIPGIKSEA
ncbi:unnamed protein product [Ambrosiozyma monospora]|uniref:Unnamed protein product n=1 Tax=Ambrosiozyma monospora TaxID=43982 RepID=A0ACB5UD39_AMBMO|nr:unnamed protein product [Ambrosiozyma monospora]